MSGWVTDLWTALDAGTPAVLISVADAAGSTPRVAGTRMVVTAGATRGTIGGGNLEYQAIKTARELLATGAAMRLTPVALGPELGQCCGGRVALHFEALSARPAWLAKLRECLAPDEPAVLVTDTEAPGRLVVTATNTAGDERLKTPANLSHARRLLAGAAGEAPAGLLFDRETAPALKVALFGAGHVGRALAAVFATLPCQLLWIDPRADEFPEPVPAGVTRIVADDPADVIDDLPTGAHMLVMTHSHQLDLEVVDSALRRGDFASLGLIGSTTKRARFEKRLRGRGFADAQLARLTCPIGVDGIADKAPGAIAVAAAAQILQRHEAARAGRNEEMSA